jgi:hypothetical protein
LVKISNFGEDFLLLGLRIGKHIKGYVDFYFGPEDLKQLVENESIISPNKLLNDSNTLIKELEVQSFDKQREKYIKKLLIAMKTSTEILNGAKFSFKDKVLRLYDVYLQPSDESEVNDLKEEYNMAYVGSGSLEERMEKLKEQRKVPESDVFVLFKKALKIVKIRTKELFPNLLPTNEHINVELIGNYNNEHKAKWSYYNWYQGNYTSRIEVNQKYNMYWSSLLSAAAHEGYPGHHSEFAVKEYYLFHEKAHFEHSILLLNSPTLIISEGIANTAINVLFSYRDQAEISLEEFCSDKHEETPLDTLIKQYNVKRKINQFIYNLTYHALLDEWSEEKITRYATSLEIFSKKEIDNRLKLINDPVHSTTSLSYFLGSKLIINKFGEFPSTKSFIELLTKPILPSDLK